MKTIMLACCLCFLLASVASTGEFEGLKPGVSKKADADRVLGPPIKEVIKGAVYDYNPDRHDAGRISIKFNRDTQLIETIDLYFKTKYDKAQYKTWFALQDPVKTVPDATGNLVEYYFPQKVSLHYEGPTVSNPVRFFSHFDPNLLQKEIIREWTVAPERNMEASKKPPEYSTPTPIEPPRMPPEANVGIPHLDVEVQNLTKEVAASVGLLEGAGVLVKSVKKGGPAALAGVLPGDVILSFRGTWVTDARILTELTKSTPSGTKSPVYIDRRGKRLYLTVLLGALPPTPTPPPSQFDKSTTESILGKWRWFNGLIVEITGGGMVAKDSRGNMVDSGGWRVIDASKRRYEMKWRAGWTDTLTLSLDNNSLEGTNQVNGRVSANRIVQ